MKRLWSKTEVEGIAKESSKQLYRHNIIVKGSCANTGTVVCRCTIIDDQAVGYTTSTRFIGKLYDIGDTEASGGITISGTTYPTIALRASGTTVLLLDYNNSGQLSNPITTISSVVDVVKAI